MGDLNRKRGKRREARERKEGKQKGREERGRAKEGFDLKSSNLIFFNSQNHHLSKICLLSRKFSKTYP